MVDNLTIATRGSKLALIQSEWVADRLRELNPGLKIELLKIKTKGDKILDVPLAKVGGKGLFVKEIQEAILDGRAQLAVHSVKDMPTDLPPGLHLAAVPVREDRRDALISKNGEALAELAPGSRVGTSSLRRSSQILARRPDLKIVSIRGSVQTRLAKIEEGEAEAVILAAAGLRRMGLENLISQYLDPEEIIPAVGQGALGLECAVDDGRTNELVAGLNDPRTWIEVAAERSFLKTLEGGCQVPIACRSQVTGDSLTMAGLVADLSGTPVILEEISGTTDLAEELGRSLAEKILSRGGAEILKEVYNS